MVCIPAEVEAFNSEGARIRLPIRRVHNAVVDQTVATVDARLAVNRKAAAA
jgi:hypothetical protein